MCRISYTFRICPRAEIEDAYNYNQQKNWWKARVVTKISDQKLHFTSKVMSVVEAIRCDEWFFQPAPPIIHQWRNLVVPPFNSAKTNSANYHQYSLYTKVYIRWSSIGSQRACLDTTVLLLACTPCWHGHLTLQHHMPQLPCGYLGRIWDTQLASFKCCL